MIPYLVVAYATTTLYRVANDTTDYLTKFVHYYFIKDHLGNVRTVMAATPMTLNYFASHEIGSAGIEQVLFDNIPNVWNTNPDGSPGNVMAAELIAENPDKRIGTAIMLHTMPGDHFDISVKSFYEGEGIPEETVAPEDVVSSLFSTLTGGGTYGGVPVTDLPDNLNTIQTVLGNPDLASKISELPITNEDPSAPKAYLNTLFFDDKLELIPSESKKIQVTASVAGNSWEVLNGNGNIGTTVVCPSCPSGVVLIYIDNQTIGKTVWFDDLFVGHYNSEILEENHYYPYGLTLSKAVSTAPNSNKYQGIELEKHFGIETYETFHRGLDPQLGRFNSIDPKSEFVHSFSPYSSMNNNPIYFIDPLGDLFRVATDSKSKEDVMSILENGKKNSKYVNIDGEGNVTLNFGDMDQKQIDGILSKDKGLALIAKLVDATETYFYEVGDEEKFSTLQEPDELQSRTFSKEQTEKVPHDATSNISRTFHHPDFKDKPKEMMPPPGISGYVRISPGKFGRNVETRIDDGNGGFTTRKVHEFIRRAATVYHELSESWYRTTKGLYYDYGSPAAHPSAVADEGSTYGNSQPISTFKHE